MRSSRWHAIVTAGAVVLVVAGCSAPAAPAPPAGTAAPKAAAAAACPTGRQGEVRVAGLGGATQTIFESLAPQFERETCMKLVFVPKGVSSEVLALIQAEAANPTIDAVDLDYNTALQGFSAGLFQPLDPAVVTNIQDLYPFAKVEGDLGAITAVAALGLVYQPQVFAEQGWAPPTSWNDLLRPEFAQKVVMPASSTSFAPLNALRFAEMNGGSLDNLQPGYAVLTKLAPNVLTYEATIPRYSQLFQGKEAVIGVWSNLGSYSEKSKGVPMEFVLPKEGAYVIINYAGVVKNAPNTAGGQLWVQFRLGQTVQTAVADGVNWGPSNAKVQLPDAIASRVIYGPEQAAKLQQVDWKKFADLRPGIAEKIAKEIETIR